MMSIAVFAPGYALIEGRLDAAVAAQTSRVAEAVSGPLTAALVLYVALYGYAVLRGAITEPVRDFAVRSIKLAFIHALATGPAYGRFVAAPLGDALPRFIASAISGGAAPELGAAFDEVFAYTAWLGEAVAREGSAFDPAPYVIAAAVFLTGALASTLGFAVALLAKLALTVLVALGPAFIALALFDATRRYFFGWLSQAVNYLVLLALVLVVLELVLALMRDRWADLSTGDPVVAGLVFVALCLIGAIFFLQTPAIAAGVAGGASAGLADFAQAAASGGGLAARGLGPQEADRRAPRGGRSVRPR